MKRHFGVALGAQLRGTHTRAGTTRSIKRVHFTVDMHQSEKIATYSTQMWCHDCHCCVSGKRCIHCVAAERQDVGSCLRRHAIGTSHHAEA